MLKVGMCADYLSGRFVKTNTHLTHFIAQTADVQQFSPDKDTAFLQP